MIAQTYTTAFSTIRDVTPPYIPTYVDRPSWYMYSLKVDPSKRNSLLKHLEDKNIETRLSFPPVHIQPYYAKRYQFVKSAFPKAMEAFNSFIDIPIWANMGNEKQKYVIHTIKGFFETKF